MADEIKKAAKMTSAKYRAAIAGINSDKASASEANGRAGQASAEFTRSNSLEPQAFSFVAKLSRKDAEKAQTVLREVIVGADHMGMFDQASLMADEDLVSLMREIVLRADSGVAGAGQSNVTTLGGSATH